MHQREGGTYLSQSGLDTRLMEDSSVVHLAHEGPCDAREHSIWCHDSLHDVGVLALMARVIEALRLLWPANRHCRSIDKSPV